MRDLADIFAQLGMSQYFGAFVQEGFDSWDTILDITESDLYVSQFQSPSLTFSLSFQSFLCKSTDLCFPTI